MTTYSPTTITLTEQEAAFIKHVFSQLSISPASPEAVGIVGFVQSILSKLEQGEQKDDSGSV